MLKQVRKTPRPVGRKPLPEDQKLHRRYVYATETDWEKVDRNGGTPWVRGLIQSAREEAKQGGAA